ncbi:hypothetical protein BofuT4_uP099680.1 [Botrytis cinerea T4]|uniref:Uncharacterized protein n=1 Tax=Botryotinia fuckeliana (strain T4) TaxID=999810 RepID=G2YC17_BOTF4|nr:hypothetical protein BofuT4_uP099680.1 [Botrytis cinerea T4]
MTILSSPTRDLAPTTKKKPCTHKMEERKVCVGARNNGIVSTWSSPPYH